MIQSLNVFSVRLDPDGRQPPTTPEGLKKKEASMSFPLYRYIIVERNYNIYSLEKKYDWNLRLWSQHDQKRLCHLVIQRMRTVQF